MSFFCLCTSWLIWCVTVVFFSWKKKKLGYWPKKLRITKYDLAFDLPELLMIIWSYTVQVHYGCCICSQYKEWCIQYVKEKWKPEYFDFDFVIQKIEDNDMSFIDFGKISFNKRNKILYFLKKEWWFLFCLFDGFFFFF